MDQLITLSQLSVRTGRSVSTLRRAARRLGLAKVGHGWVFTGEQAEAVAAICRDKPGNPEFGTTWRGGKPHRT